MLELIASQDHPLAQQILSDPVRPLIALEDRLCSPNSFVLSWVVNGQAQSFVCIRLCNSVPNSVEQLLSSQSGSVAVFYSIWSLVRGSGRVLLLAARDWLLLNREVTEFYTLSPPGESVRNFHFGLGAGLFRTNGDTVNYHYNNLSR